MYIVIGFRNKHSLNMYRYNIDIIQRVQLLLLLWFKEAIPVLYHLRYTSREWKNTMFIYFQAEPFMTSTSDWQILKYSIHNVFHIEFNISLSMPHAKISREFFFWSVWHEIDTLIFFHFAKNDSKRHKQNYGKRNCCNLCFKTRELFAL